MKAIMLMYDTLNRRYLPPYGNTSVQAPQFHPSRGQVGGVRSLLRGIHALHAGPARAPHGTVQFPPPRLGSVGAVRRLYARAALRARHPHTLDFRPLPLLGGRRAPPITIATPPGASSAARRATAGEAEVGETPALADNLRPQDRVNRRYMTTEADQPQTKVFDEGLEFLAKNHDRDNWFPPHGDL